MPPPPLAQRGRAGNPRRAARFQPWELAALGLTAGCVGAGAPASSDVSETGAAQIATGLSDTGGLGDAVDGQDEQTANSDQTGTLDTGAGPLGPGDNGQRVVALQVALAQLGYDPGTPDGAFGERTKTAVLELQKNADLEPDGIVGSKTAEAINERLAARG